MKRILLFAVVFALFTTAASAQRGHDVVQHQRIKRGFENGQLTRGEKFRLQKNQARYRHARRKAGRDGKITPMEKRRLYHMRKKNSRKTFYMKHNARRRVF